MEFLYTMFTDTDTSSLPNASMILKLSMVHSEERQEMSIICLVLSVGLL